MTTRAATRPAAAPRIDMDELLDAYHTRWPDPSDARERIAFGTSGHRGSSLRGSFNDAHIAALCQAIVEYRAAQRVTGPLFVGRDTHALSEPAWRTAHEVFAANGMQVVADTLSAYTPTPVISHAILRHNRGGGTGTADGVVITPSHNPPEDGGFKYNPPTGGPADTDATAAIEHRANEILRSGGAGVKRSASALEAVERRDLARDYIDDLANVLDMDAIAGSGVRIGVDPLGGASLEYWEPIADRYGLQLEVVNRTIDSSFAFMPLDWDGRIRMDCSSPHAMAGLIGLKDRYDVAIGCDPDADRHGIVTPSAGLLNPNHYLAAAIFYLFRNRKRWSTRAAVGKTLVSSAMIDRVTRSLGRELVEVPVGFKWFVEGLGSGSIAFGGEESAGASFVRKNGGTWTTDKDGILLGLLAAELTARTERDPAELYAQLEARFGRPVYERQDAAATPQQKDVLKKLSPADITATELAGEAIVAKSTRAPGNGAPIGGVKVVAANGWFAARPSGTEDVYKIYAESFIDVDHLRRIQAEAQEMVSAAFRRAGA